MRAQPPALVLVGGGADRGAEILGAPGHAAQARQGRGLRVAGELEGGGSGFGGDGQDVDFAAWQAGLHFERVQEVREAAARPAAPAALGSMMPSGEAAMTAAKSVNSGRFVVQCVDPAPIAQIARAGGGPFGEEGRNEFAGQRLAWPGATESSRSRMTASAPAPSALASFLSLSPGTKSKDRSIRSAMLS